MNTKPPTPVSRRDDLRILGKIALLLVAAIVAAPAILFFLVHGQSGRLSDLAPVALLVVTLAWFAYLAFAPRPEDR